MVLKVQHANGVYIPITRIRRLRRNGTRRKIIAMFPVADELHLVQR